MSRGSSNILRLAAALAGIAAGSAVFPPPWFRAANTATVSTVMLMVVLVVAATSPLWVAVTASVFAVLAFNFAFLAVYVETPRETPERIRSHDAEALQQNIKLAENLAATVVRVRAAARPMASSPSPSVKA